MEMYQFTFPIKYFMFWDTGSATKLSPTLHFNSGQILENIVLEHLKFDYSLE